jgi:hypothetical protein
MVAIFMKGVQTIATLISSGRAFRERSRDIDLPLGAEFIDAVQSSLRFDSLKTEEDCQAKKDGKSPG